MSLKATFNEFKKALKDCFTSANGDYDPARVVGYLVVLLGALIFMGGMVFNTIVDKRFDADAFMKGLSGLSLTMTAAAGGVWIKKSSEITPSPAEVAPKE